MIPIIMKVLQLFMENLLQKNIDHLYLNSEIAPTSTLVVVKIRNYIKCYSCLKIRCLYSDIRLTLEETESLQIAKELFDYSCGRLIFPEGYPLATKIWVRICISCDSLIEWLYYSSKKSGNVLICYYCGQDNNLINIPQELKNSISYV